MVPFKGQPHIMARHIQLKLKVYLFNKLAAAQARIAIGNKGRTLKQVMKDIRKRLRESSYLQP